MMNEEEVHENRQFEALIQGLIDDDYGCCDDFVLPSTVIGLIANIQLLSESGKMKPSGFGNKIDFKQDLSVRGDKINWIEEKSVNPFELIYLKKIEKFIIYLNTSCFTSIKSFESHYSTYGKTNVYKRHLDQFKNEKGRKFSIVLYLNQEWREVDGGLLSLHPKAADQVDISPFGGRLVFFRSDEMEHEVHASFTRTRQSIAGWMKD